MPELRDALREATNKLGILAGNPQLIAFDAMLTSYPTLTVAGAIGFGVNPANAFAGAAATIEVIANGANVPTFTGITATGSYVNTAGAVNRIEFECLPSGPGSALAFYAKIGNGGGAAPVTSVAGKTGTVTLVKADVGLANVDNTADSAKPVSIATQAAINAITPGSIGADIAGIKILTPTPTDPGNAASNSVFLSWLIAAMRGAQATLSALGTLATKSTIVSDDITDGTIVDADISSTAAISASKLTGVQPLSPTLTQIGNLANGIPEITGAGTAASIVPSASGRTVLTDTPAAARGAIGLGALAVEGVTPSALFGITDWAVPAAASADVICDAFFGANVTWSTAGSITYYTPDQWVFNEELISLLATDIVVTLTFPQVIYSNGFIFLHGYADAATNLQRPSTAKIELFNSSTNVWSTVLAQTAWPADNRNLWIIPVPTTSDFLYSTKARISLTGVNYWMTKIRWVLTRSNYNQVIYKPDTRLQTIAGPVGVRSLIVNGGATQTASLRGSKTIGTPSATDTITVVGAAVGDIVNVSRGKDAFVSAANTVQFDSTGLGGVLVSAIVERFV